MTEELYFDDEKMTFNAEAYNRAVATLDAKVQSQLDEVLSRLDNLAIEKEKLQVVVNRYNSVESEMRYLRETAEVILKHRLFRSTQRAVLNSNPTSTTLTPEYLVLGYPQRNTFYTFQEPLVNHTSLQTTSIMDVVRKLVREGITDYKELQLRVSEIVGFEVALPTIRQSARRTSVELASNNYLAQSLLRNSDLPGDNK